VIISMSGAKLVVLTAERGAVEGHPAPRSGSPGRDESLAGGVADERGAPQLRARRTAAPTPRGTARPRRVRRAAARRGGARRCRTGRRLPGTRTALLSTRQNSRLEIARKPAPRRPAGVGASSSGGRYRSRAARSAALSWSRFSGSRGGQVLGEPAPVEAGDLAGVGPAVAGDRDGQDIGGGLGGEGDTEQPGPAGLVDPVAGDQDDALLSGRPLWTVCPDVTALHER